MFNRLVDPAMSAARLFRSRLSLSQWMMRQIMQATKDASQLAGVHASEAFVAFHTRWAPPIYRDRGYGSDPDRRSRPTSARPVAT
jgi:hypothetical protein